MRVVKVLRLILRRMAVPSGCTSRSNPRGLCSLAVMTQLYVISRRERLYESRGGILPNIYFHFTAWFAFIRYEYKGLKVAINPTEMLYHLLTYLKKIIRWYMGRRRRTTTGREGKVNSQYKNFPSVRSSLERVNGTSVSYQQLTEGMTAGGAVMGFSSNYEAEGIHQHQLLG